MHGCVCICVSRPKQRLMSEGSSCNVSMFAFGSRFYYTESRLHRCIQHFFSWQNILLCIRTASSSVLDSIVRLVSLPPEGAACITRGPGYADVEAPCRKRQCCSTQSRRQSLSCSPSVRRARPPVGVHSTAEQLLQTTTVWEWLNTVVLQSEALLTKAGKQGSRSDHRAGEDQNHGISKEHTRRVAYIWKQPAHFTSMKKEFGDCTSRFSLCFCFSSSGGGCRRSMSLERTCSDRGQRHSRRAYKRH